MGHVKTIFEIAKLLAELLLILVAGWWAFEREIFEPRLNLQLEKEIYRIESGQSYLRSYLNIKNSGEVPVRIKKIRVRIFQIEPFVKKYVPDFNVKNNQGQFNWPELDEAEFVQKIDVSPNEEHRQSFDFMLPKRVRCVRMLMEVFTKNKGDVIWRSDNTFLVAKDSV